MGPIGQAGLALLGTGLNVWQEDRRERRQHENQKDLMQYQHGNQMILNEQGHKLQYDMWKKTNFPAQMEMLKEAGLSPGLMYGMGGAGGSTTGSQGGGSAASGQASKGNSMDIANMAMLGKQMELVDAQTKKTNAEATKIAETDTQEGQQRIAESGSRIDVNTQNIETMRKQIEQMDADIRESSTRSELNEVNRDLQELELYIQGKTSGMKMRRIKYDALNAAETYNEASMTNDVIRSTMEERKSLVRSSAYGAILKNILTDQGIQKTQTEIMKMVNDVKMSLVDRIQRGEEIDIKKAAQQFQEQYPGLWNVAGMAVDTWLQQILELEADLTRLWDKDYKSPHPKGQR